MNIHWIFYGILLATETASSWLVSTKFSNICSRVYFPHQRDIRMPYSVLLSGVYVRTQYVSNDFPVYKSERSNVYFYRRSDYLVFSKTVVDSAVTDRNGPRIDEYAGLGVAITSLSSAWTATANNSTLPFGSAISNFQKWFVWIPQNTMTGYSKSANYQLAYSISPVCVSQTVAECGYGRPLYFNVTQTGANGVNINNPNIDEFVQLPDVYRYDRPVYKHSNFATSSWYLFYINSVWAIGPDYDVYSAFWAAIDNATKPELITSKWQVRKSGWVDSPASIICKGQKLGTTCPRHDPCVRGTCYNNPRGETLCACPWGWTGQYCETPSPRCGYYMPGDVGYVELDAGTIVTYFCPDEYVPTYYGQQCQKQQSLYSWVPLAARCQNITTTKTPVTWSSWSSRNSLNRKRVSPFNADDARWFLPGMIAMGLLLNFGLPYAHWRFRRCIRVITVQKAARFSRVFSGHFYFGLILWVVYLLLSIILHLRNYGTMTFFVLNVMALVMIAISYVAVLVESCFTYERKRLSDKFAGEGRRMYFRQLLSAMPVVSVSITCYHYETRTRTVEGTFLFVFNDPQEETYQERVDTYTESEIFQYAACRDISDWSLMPNEAERKITMIKLQKDVRMADADTLDACKRLQGDLVERNRHRDAYIDCNLSQTIPNFKERVKMYDPTRDLPCWMTLTCYWISTILWCTWPFRWCMGSATKHDEFTVVKEISIYPDSLPQQAFPPMLGRGHVGPALSDDPAEVIHMVAHAPPATASGAPQAVIYDPDVPLVSGMYPPYSIGPPPSYILPSLSQVPKIGFEQLLSLRN